MRIAVINESNRHGDHGNEKDTPPPALRRSHVREGVVGVVGHAHVCFQLNKERVSNVAGAVYCQAARCFFRRIARDETASARLIALKPRRGSKMLRDGARSERKHKGVNRRRES